jgi:uncharacterized protein with von Willebrand factor type A (vWA) domain
MTVEETRRLSTACRSVHRLNTDSEADFHNRARGVSTAVPESYSE